MRIDVVKDAMSAAVTLAYMLDELDIAVIDEPLPAQGGAEGTE